MALPFIMLAVLFRGIENYRFEIQEFRDPAWPAATAGA